jgi:NADH-quinone oxidoreductase subunit D
MTPVSDHLPDGDLLLGIGVAGRLPGARQLRLAEFHPSAHAGFELQVSVADGVVTSADPRLGLMHRSSEKLFEARDYRQLMMLANRHDWVSAFSSELGVALAVEAATGITPPERATWIRTLLAESNRVFAALAFLAPVLDGPVRQEADRLREELTTAQELATGNRVHPMFTRIGGVATLPPGPVLDAYARIAADLMALQEQLAAATAAYAESVRGLVPVPREDAIGFALSGPVARASGLDMDLRRDDPYLDYADLADLLTIPVRTAGDAAARYEVLVGQVPSSAALMAACVAELGRLGDGPVDVLLPKVLRVPEGTTHTWIEGPLGISGYLLASAGEKTPWRLKVRSTAFNTLQAVGPALVGTPVDRLPDALMSFFLVIGDADR